ncbi:hypothetical protein ACVOMV_27760 (plasmid) [Mesorhizobium atlanticum]|uniref:hypothetical protein n=1 Tax=Mesorhizobium atlanticum TaxID=2233532 RepID=UPI003704B4AD
MTFGSLAKGVLAAIGSFALLGTVAALWADPFFTRMTPTSGFEVGLLALQAILLGVYVAIPVPACALKIASLGGVANYIGIACPICNKVLLFVFGANALLTYLEPVRLYLAAGGALVTLAAVLMRWRNYRLVSANPALSFAELHS